MLAIFVEGGRADGAQLTARECRLQEVGCVDGTFSGAGADQRV